nr:sirohydrochlorin cobaltochelatase [Deltaproteobacteria bacterium]
MRIIQALIFTSLLLLTSLCPASDNQYGKESRAAIVIASFGTTQPQALAAILNIQAKVKAAFPDTPVALAFT